MKAEVFEETLSPVSSRVPTLAQRMAASRRPDRAAQ